ncbi:MAG: hypothetical protein RRY39_07755 [Odoribacter sp.]
MKMKTGCILLLISLCVGCNNKKREITQLVERWQNKEIVFPDNLEMKIYGRDTFVDLSATKYKILNYVDTSGCTECRMKLYEWRLLKEEADSLQLEVRFVFVAYVKQFEEVETLQRINRFNTPFLYDRHGDMNKINNFSELPMFQTFLLDEHNKVLLIGSPVGNEKLWKLYKEKMKSLD